VRQLLKVLTPISSPSCLRPSLTKQGLCCRLGSLLSFRPSLVTLSYLSESSSFSCRAPDRPNEFLVKRLIGLQGDWVSIPETQDVTRVPEGKCWVEGDNALASSDSREFGAVRLL
jgi:signal peptidase I